MTDRMARSINRCSLVILLPAIFLLPEYLCQAQAHAADNTVVLLSGMNRIEAEVAATPESREVGLMHRQFMPDYHGMVFVFPNAGQHCMWMKNTLLPLSVAFLDATGHVINIEDMQPQTETNHCAAKPASYALEMNYGWFSARSIKPGSVLTGLDKTPVPH